MNARKQLVALAVAALLGAGPLVSLAQAADAPASNPAAMSKGDPSRPGTGQGDGTQSASAGDGSAQPPNPIIRTSEETALAVQDIHAARLAIFEGMNDDATRLVEEAVGKLDDAQSALASQAMSSSGSGQAGKAPDGKGAGANQQASAGNAGKAGSGQAGQGGQGSTVGSGEDLNGYLPFDTSIALMEGFTPGTEHRQALDQAGKQMRQGDQKGAAESLALADIDVSVSAAMLPAKSSLDQVRKAGDLIGRQKWQEANLALKSVEDSIQVRTWDYHGVPRQGVQGESGQPSGSTGGPEASGQNG